MRSANSLKRSIALQLGREAFGTLLPAVLAVGLFLLVPSVTRSQAESAPARTKPEDAVLCDTWHRGSGETVLLDLARVKRAYEGLQARVTRALEAEPPRPSVDLRQPYDTGLPACKGESTRTAKVAPEKGARMKGRVLYFVAVGDPSRIEVPPEVERDPSVQVLVLRVRSLGDLPEIAKRFGRPVNLAGSDFAKVLGVRCANSWVKFSEKGDEIEIRESR